MSKENFYSQEAAFLMYGVQDGIRTKGARIALEQKESTVLSSRGDLRGSLSIHKSKTWKQIWGTESPLI